MTKYDLWAGKARKGECCNCRVDGLVFDYDRSNFSSRYATDGTKMPLCYICCTVVGVNAQEYPEQHPYHDSVVAPIIGAISLLLQEIRRPKKPSKPRQPKLMKRTPGTK